LFRLNGVSPIEVTKRTWNEIRAEDVLGRAAQLAYYFFLALFPFLICVVASLSVFGVADRGRALLFELFAHILPRPAFQLISTTFDEILKSGGPLKMSFGIIISLWSASMGMSAVMDTLNAAYRVRETRSLIKQYGVAMGLTFGITLLIVASLIIALFVDSAVGTPSRAGIAGLIWRIARWPLGTALLLLIFELTYYFAPDLRNREWHWITPGAIAGILLLVLVSVGLRIYLHLSGNSVSTYGSVGAVIILLLSAYLGGIALLSGGSLNGVLQRLVAGSDHVFPIDLPPSSEKVPE
jgi:membrane protein